MEGLATALGALTLLVAVAALLWVARRAPGPALGAVALGVAATLGLALGLRGVAAPSPPEGPPEVPWGGYLGSAGCKSCHPGEHASWERSFHRSMTRRPTRETVNAPWSGTVGVGPRRLELFERAGALWVGCPSPEEEAERVRAGRGPDGGVLQRAERPLALVTGSHHYQVYWVEAAGGELRPLPWVWLIGDRAWIPREAAFLQPEGSEHLARWNSGCIQCHAVAGRPRHDIESDRFRTEVAELGIACEACHGPGRAHAAQLRGPLARLRARGNGPKGPIVLPTSLEPRRGAEVCGQCHSLFTPRDAARFWENGVGFRPGEPLRSTHAGLDPLRSNGGSDLERMLGAVGQSVDDVTWPGGAVRVGGREWDAMTASACHKRGSLERQMVCTSCHSMHDAPADDQLRRDRPGDEACLGCHEALRLEPARHTRHEPDSDGSRCVNCHMPFTSYALLKGIRSHRVSSPRVSALHDDRQRGMEPNACNLCHLDRSLGWAARELARRFGVRDQVPLGPLEETVAAGVLWVVAGDAAQRALAAFAMGRAEARAASGADWEAPYLADLLVDSYPAVRKVAERALRGSYAPGLVFDFLGPEAERAGMRDRLVRGHLARRGPAHALLLDESGARDDARLQLVRAERRDRPLLIAE